MRRSKTLVVLLMLFVFISSAKGKERGMNSNDARAVIQEYLSKYEPLDLELRKAWYEYDTTGDKKASEREAAAELAIKKLNSDKGRFAKLKNLFKNRNQISDDIVRREIEVLYLTHLPNQVSEEMLRKTTELDKRLRETFNDYRPEVDGKKLGPDEVERIMTDSTDGALLEKVWKAEHKKGPLLEKDYRETVKLRNQIARDLGYENTLALAAEVGELDLKAVDKFYEDVRRITDKPFRELKENFIDPRLATRYGISVKDLKPWHYQNMFFQEAPNAIFGKVDLDDFYKNFDSNKAVNLAIDFYASFGVDINPIIKNSSLFPKPGKNPHAVAWFLNPNKPNSSVLIMNLPKPPAPPKASDVSTLIHELSHDINYEAILRNKALPYLLREPTMLTEAVAMLFEKQTQTMDWFRRLGVPEEKAREAVETVQLIDYVDQLVFLRWSAAIYCFEKGIYTNPDRDIGGLWWECRGRDQLLQRPEGWTSPDALVKYHITNASPLYYTSYAIGRVANVQFADIIAKRIHQDVRGASYFGMKDLGAWLMNDFLAQGERYRWDDFIKLSTGRPLSLDAWKAFYIDSDLKSRLR